MVGASSSIKCFYSVNENLCRCVIPLLRAGAVCEQGIVHSIIVLLDSQKDVFMILLLDYLYYAYTWQNRASALIYAQACWEQLPALTDTPSHKYT